MTCLTIPNNPIYMDNAATTPLLHCVKERIYELLDCYGNPSSLYSIGNQSLKILDDARETIAKCINCSPDELFFTSGATEANNWVTNCAANSFVHSESSQFITSEIEHPSMYNGDKKAKRTVFVCPDNSGIINPHDVAEYIQEYTSFKNTQHFVSIMLANNEIGTVQPISEIVASTKKYIDFCNNVYVHTDATQAVGSIPVDVEQLGVDFMSFSGHKFNAPKGIGCLYVRKNKQNMLSPLLFGGSQERHKRAGTENVIGIAAMATALKYNTEHLAEKMKKISIVRNCLLEELLTIEDSHINGSLTSRLPGNINIRFDGVESESLQMLLDMRNICVSQGSACSSGSLKPSRILKAIGLTDDEAHSSIRITLGSQNTLSECDYVFDAIKKSVEQLRSQK